MSPDARTRTDLPTGQEEVCVPVIVIVDGIPYAGQARREDGWNYIKVFRGIGHEKADRIFSDDKFGVPLDQLTAILDGNDISMSVPVRPEYQSQQTPGKLLTVFGVVRLAPPNSHAAVETEAAAQWECATHQGGCKRCPSCKNLSYCNGCYTCGPCGYPGIAETAPAVDGRRFSIERGWLHFMIRDGERDRHWSPRQVFSHSSSEYRWGDLSMAERCRVLTEIGDGMCVRLLDHYMFAMGKGGDAESDVEYHRPYIGRRAAQPAE